MNASGFTLLVLLFDSFYCGLSCYTSQSLVLVFFWIMSSLGPRGVISVFLLRIGHLNELSSIMISIILGKYSSILKLRPYDTYPPALIHRHLLASSRFLSV